MREKPTNRPWQGMTVELRSDPSGKSTAKEDSEAISRKDRVTLLLHLEAPLYSLNSDYFDFISCDSFLICRSVGCLHFFPKIPNKKDLKK